tara:strand:- start:171 stop:566 length:396 start_codon:yes stop_codon:yes gene_type:complete
LAKKHKIHLDGGSDLKSDLWGNSCSHQKINTSKLNQFALRAEEHSDNKHSIIKIRSRLLKNGKGCKPVTELYEWPTSITDSDLKKILLKMKQSFGCGGTVKDKRIELQGDKCAEADQHLSKEGYKLIRSGG